MLGALLVQCLYKTKVKLEKLTFISLKWSENKKNCINFEFALT